MSETKDITELQERMPRPTQPLAVFNDIQSFEAAQRIAKALMTADVVPQQYRQNLGNTLVAIELAQRTKASVLAVMQNIAVIHGKPSWEAKFLIGAINTCGKFSPLRYKMTGEEGKDSWGCRAWAYDARTREELIGPEVTISMAKAEGWHGKQGSKWKTMPEVMLRYRAASFWARQYAPEISLGMPTADEARDTYEARPVGPGEYSAEVEPKAPVDVGELQEQKPAFYDNPPAPHAWDGAAPIPNAGRRTEMQDSAPPATDYVDSMGAPFNRELHAWDASNVMPRMNADGRFAARRGKATQAAEWERQHKAPTPASVVDETKTDNGPAGAVSPAADDFGDLE